MEKPEIESVLAAEFGVPNKSELSKLGLNYGVKVNELKKGKLKSIGISKGFIITKVDKQPVKTVDQLTKLLQKSESEGILIEGVYPNGMKAYYGMGM